MVYSFEIAREDAHERPPFCDGCETCQLKKGNDFDGVVVPYATVTYGTGLMAFYSHARCGATWFTSWSAQYSHTWVKVGNPMTPITIPPKSDWALPAGPATGTGEAA